ncbi:MAG: glycosyltransferase family 4 protein [Phycisphaerales bacterium]|jgi:glycosyltransferase involved in cell wall biosynthesis|nr:glycosyltransferase family 4 protein [Phycisphaerales bacterium]
MGQADAHNPTASPPAGDPARAERPLRILLINQTFWPDVSATAQHLADFAEHMTARGHEVAVIASRRSYEADDVRALPKKEVWRGITIHRVPGSPFGRESNKGRMLDFFFFVLFAGLRATFLRRAHVVCTLTTPPMVGLIGLWLKLIKRSRFVYWVMDLYPDVMVVHGMLTWKSPIAKFLEFFSRMVIRHCDAAVALGPKMAQILRAKGARNDRVEVVSVWSDAEEVNPDAPDAGAFRREHGLDGKFLVVYAGNLGIMHDAQVICRAAEHLAHRDDVRFLFVGSGRRRPEAEQFAKDHNLTNVTFYPYQPREKLGGMLTSADVHLITMVEGAEGLIVPSKLFGIMAAGRPSIFIGPRDADTAQVIDAESCGVCLSPHDDEGLAREIERLAVDRAEREQFGHAARRALLARYTRAHSCEALDAICARVTGRSSARVTRAGSPIATEGAR